MDETFGSLLRTVQQAQSQVLDFEADYGVTAAQFSVLNAVINQPGIDQRGVMAATFIDKSTVASVVTKLVERGLLVSTRNGTDARRDQLIATREAVAIVYDGALRLEAGNEALLAALPADKRERFHRLLRELAYADRRTPPEHYVIPSPDGRRPTIELRWGLGRSLRGCLQRHNRLWAEQFGTLVTPIQYLALNALGKSPHIDQGTLGDIILLDKASLTAVLDRMQRRGLVTRLRDPADGRRRLLELTPPGQVLLSGAREQVPRVDAAFIAPLAANQHSFFTGALRQLAQVSRARLTSAPRSATA